MPQFPLVWRSRYEDARDDYKRTQEEAAGYLQRIDELEMRIAELTSSEEETKRSIAEVEGRIRVAELEFQLKKLQEQPAAEEQSRPRPTIDKVRRIAAEVREQRKSGKS